jgi:hypothetical protein
MAAQVSSCIAQKTNERIFKKNVLDRVFQREKRMAEEEKTRQDWY